MQQTYSFTGTTLRGYRYLFFALYEDYLDFRRSFVQEFNVHLERFGRDLESFGAVVTPFAGDIEKTRNQVLSKPWTEEEHRELERVPSLLVINTDFDNFSPGADPWILFHFGEGRFGDPQGLAELDRTFRAIAALATDEDSDISNLFTLAQAFGSERPDLTKVFRAQPGMFGFSIDLASAGKQIWEWLEHRRRPTGRA